MASAYDLTALTDYVNVHKDELLVKVSLGGNTLDNIEIMTNVKFKDALNYLDSTVSFADGSVCGFSAAGSDVFTEKTIETIPIKVEKEWCYKDWRKKYGNYQLMWEAGRETLPFEEKVTNENMVKIQEELESAIWKGVSAISLVGFLDLIDADTDAIEVTAVTGATATSIVEGIYDGLTDRMLKKGVKIFMNPALFRKYIQEQNATCCANRTIIDANTQSLVYVGDSRVTLIPVIGLTGVDEVVAVTPDALVYATDVEGADNVYKMWFCENDEMFRMRVLFNAGTQIKWDDEVVFTKY